MDKITWEDGTKEKQGYVTINNVDYDITETTYSGQTPINAKNLNLMQTNAENAINEVQSNVDTANTNIETNKNDIETNKNDIETINTTLTNVMLIAEEEDIDND